MEGFVQQHFQGGILIMGGFTPKKPLGLEESNHYISFMQPTSRLLDHGGRDVICLVSGL